MTAGSFHTSGIRYPVDNLACRGLYQVYTGYRLTRGGWYIFWPVGANLGLSSDKHGITQTGLFVHGISL